MKSLRLALLAPLRWVLIVIHRMLSFISFFALIGGVFPLAIGLVDAASRNNDPHSYYLTSIAYSGGKKLISVGERGVIMLSDDSGSTWHFAKSLGEDTLTGVVFADPDRVWIVGHAGTLMRSNDAGESWVSVFQGTKVAELALIEAQRINASATGDKQRQLAERLQGNAQRMIDSGSSEPLFSLLFTDVLHGFAVGAYGVVLRTDDGGKTWNAWLSHVENPRQLHIYAIAKVDGVIYLAGEQGFIARSTDGGEHFSRLETEFSGSFFTVTGASDQSIYAAGLEGVVIRSTNKGDSWTAIEGSTKQSWVASEATSDGAVILANASGGFFRAAAGTALTALTVFQDGGLSGFITLPDGTIVVAGPRGISNKPVHLSGSVTSEIR